MLGDRLAKDAAPATEARHTASVELRLIALAEWPATADFDALAKQTRLVLDLDDDSPVLPASALVPGARVGRGRAARTLLQRLVAGDFGRYEEVEAGSVRPLPLGTSRSLGIATNELTDDPDNFLGEYARLGPIEKRIVLHVGHASGDIPWTVALFVEDAARPLPDQRNAEAAIGERPARAQRLLRELVVLDDGAQPNQPLAVVFRSPFDSGAASAWLAWIDVVPPPLDDKDLEVEHQSDFEAALAAIEGALDQETDGQDIDHDRRVLERALAELTATGDERAALVYLAGAAGAPLSEELALFATPELLTDLIEPIANAARELARTELSIGWLIERSTILFLAGRSVEGDLDPEVAATLLRHTGEAGRYASALEQAVVATPNHAAFVQALVLENRIFLEDTNPSARVRAFDWLAGRNLAPADYDPLAPRDERRAALAAAEVRDEQQ